MLMENVRVLDHRFSVRLRLPAEPGPGVQPAESTVSPPRK